MNNKSEIQDTTTEDLQFDQAEFEQEEQQTNACSSCSKSIEDSYFEQNGQVLCKLCCDKIKVELNSSSGPLRFGKALSFGIIAGAIGAGIYYAVLSLTGYEVGLIAIVVGWLVGTAVNLGAEGRGGWFYQLMAVLITYSAIVSTYIPMIIQEMNNDYTTSEEIQEIAPVSNEETQTNAKETAEASEPPSQDNTSTAEAEVTAAGFLIGGVVLFVYALCVPFLAGFQNIIGLLIIGFALYQAWSMNRKIAFEITGPYKVGDLETELATENA